MQLLTSNYPMARLALLVLVATTTACTSMDHQRDVYPEPEDRLNFVLTEYDRAKEAGNECFELWDVDHATVDCERVQREVNRLFAEFPENERILMSNAVLAVEKKRTDQAQFYLDQLLNQPGAHPEAAVLRSQIALADGNVNLALELLGREIMLSPDRPELREALAAAYFVKGEYAKSRVVLALAGRLGAPGWRLSYHHGLLFEAENHWVKACQRYNLALEQKADYVPAQTRLIGLSEHPECRRMLLGPMDTTFSGDADLPARNEG